MIDRNAPGRLLEITLRDDVVAFEDGASLVPTDLHGDALRDACPDHAPDRRAPERAPEIIEAALPKLATLTEIAHGEARGLGGSLFSGPRQVSAWSHLVHEAGPLKRGLGLRGHPSQE